MSTANLSEEAEAARKALGQLTEAAEKRLAQIERDRRGHQTQRQRVVTGARLAMQSVDDLDAPLAEEESQLATALRGLPAPDDASQQAQPGSQVEPTPADPTRQPAPPAPEQPLVPGLPDQHQSTVVHHHIWEVHRWSKLQLVMGLFGALIAFLVALFTYHPLFHNIHGAGYAVLVVFWFIALVAFGFFGFGLLGWASDQDHDNDEQ